MVRLIADYLFLAALFLTPAAVLAGLLFVLAQRVAHHRDSRAEQRNAVEARAH